MTVILGTLSALSASYYGTLSDRVGRRPLLAMVSLSELLMQLGTLTLALNPSRLGIKWVLAQVTISGLMGGQMVGMAVLGAFVSDASEGGSR